MPLVASNAEVENTGLSYYATCDCHDFVYRHEGFLQLTQEQPQEAVQKQINSRWIKARDTLSVELTWQPEYPAWEIVVTGGSETHKVQACKSNENPGPNFMCKHIFAALRLILKEIEGLYVIAFGCPDTEISTLPVGWETVSVDGWMVALIEKEKKDDD